MKKEIGVCCLAMLIICLIMAIQRPPAYGVFPHSPFKHDCPFCNGYMWVEDKPLKGQHIYFHICTTCGKNYLTDECNNHIYTRYE